MKCVVTNSLTAGQAEDSTEKGGKHHFFFSFDADVHQQQWVSSGKRRHASVYLTSARYPAPPSDMAAKGLLSPMWVVFLQAVVLMPAQA